MKQTNQLHEWHHTRAGLVVFGVVELLLAYGAASWAIDNGNILLYVATLALFIGGVHNLFRLMRRPRA